jgi:phospholipid transport system substrate-binding protein
MKTALTAFAAIILITTFQPASAKASTGHSSPQAFYNPASQALDPRETIQQGVKRLQAFITSDAIANPDQVRVFMEKEVAQFFDFNAMAHLVLGPLNYRISAQQRRGATAMIKKAFLSAFAANLADYRGGKVQYMNISGNLNRGKVYVRLAIQIPNQYPSLIKLRFARGPNGWKIIDVSANGISAVAHYRNYIRSVVQRSGPDALLQ